MTHTSHLCSSVKHPGLPPTTATTIAVRTIPSSSPSSSCANVSTGSAITLSRQPNVCTNPAFKTNYNNCLQCSGPDNYDIWKMYGRTLSSAGASCGLSTEPLAGKQQDVGPAVHASGSASSGAVSATSTGSATSAAASVSRSVVPSSVTAAPVPSGNVTASRSLVSVNHERLSEYDADARHSPRLYSSQRMLVLTLVLWEWLELLC